MYYIDAEHIPAPPTNPPDILDEIEEAQLGRRVRFGWLMISKFTLPFDQTIEPSGSSDTLERDLPGSLSAARQWAMRNVELQDALYDSFWAANRGDGGVTPEDHVSLLSGAAYSLRTHIVTTHSDAQRG